MVKSLDLINCKDVNELENFLQAINQKTGFFGSLIISDDGLIVLSSKNISNDIDVESVAADAANIFNSDSNFYKDVVFSINETKVYITRMNIDGSRPMMFMTILPHNVRYYKRKINKIRNKIKHFFI